MNGSRTAALGLLLAGVLGCSGGDGGTDAGPGPAAAEVSKDNSVELGNIARRAREALPGRAHYDRACAMCHDGTVQKAPHQEMLSLMTPETIVKALTTGVMAAEAGSLSAQEKAEVAEYLSGVAPGAEVADIPSCADGVAFDPTGAVLATNWGLQPTNNRHIDAAVAGIDGGSIRALEPRWAVRFPGANRVRSQPAFAGGLLFVGAHDGQVYALDQRSGCQVWSFQAGAEVRTGIVVAASGPGEPFSLYFGDVLGNVYGITAADGELRWRVRADAHPNATITGTPSWHAGTLYVPVSALEVTRAADPGYPCCTFRGSIVALSDVDGSERWKTYTIAEEPRVQSRNASGTNMMGPSGAVVWNSPAIDAARNQLYFGTGENMSSPATLTSDALFALGLTSGKVNWVFQATAGDAWNVACDSVSRDSCPEEDGPDFDFGGAALLADSDDHGQLVIAGQKSGLVHALNPDTGALVWQTRVGRGGIQGGIHFGIAQAQGKVLVPISDMADSRSYPDPPRPGMHALDVDTGDILWSTVHAEDACGDRPFCHPGISQAPTVVGDLVLAGAMDGVLRAYDLKTGAVRWTFDSTRRFDTVVGEPTSGGSFGGAAGPVAFNGLLAIGSGYGIYNHMAGNLLMVLQTPP
ncbi:MAG: PQQ-binding-like beta-propeller repeat protein [Pseudomonadales bacterium]